jgi:DNA-binding MarR family transcriptional regulator
VPGKNQPAPSALEDHLGYWLRFLSNHVSQTFAAKVESQGVSVTAWVVMREIYDEEEINPSDIAARIGMTRGAISKIVERLVREGFLVRREREGDRRYQAIALTPRGRRLVPILAKLADENDAACFAPLSAPERASLLSTLKELVLAHGLTQIPTE